MLSRVVVENVSNERVRGLTGTSLSLVGVDEVGKGLLSARAVCSAR